VGLLVGAGLLAGCTNPLSRDARIRFSPTPELDTLYQRPVDIANALTLQEDENWRMFNQDLGRAFYVDRPSRLTREPIVHP
jgi:hypothetical protein